MNRIHLVALAQIGANAFVAELAAIGTGADDGDGRFGHRDFLRRRLVVRGAAHLSELRARRRTSAAGMSSSCAICLMVFPFESKVRTIPRRSTLLPSFRPASRPSSRPS